MFLRHPCQCQMGNPASNPTGSVRDPYGPSLEPVGRWRLVAGLSSKPDRIPPLAQQAVAVA